MTDQERIEVENKIEQAFNEGMAFAREMAFKDGYNQARLEMLATDAVTGKPHVSKVEYVTATVAGAALGGKAHRVEKARVGNMCIAL